MRAGGSPLPSPAGIPYTPGPVNTMTPSMAVVLMQARLFSLRESDGVTMG